MGLFSSSEEKIDAKGGINNNVIVEDHMKNSQSQHKEVSTLLYVIIGVIVLALLIKLIQMYNRRMKKRYSRSTEVL